MGGGEMLSWLKRQVWLLSINGPSFKSRVANARVVRGLWPLTFHKIVPLAEPNSQYRNIHRGKRCFVLGNGPSLKNIDFSLLANEYTFTVNQLARRDDFPKLHTNYHVIQDESLFALKSDRPEDLEIVDVLRRTTAGGAVLFLKTSARDMVERFHLDQEMTIRYFMQSYDDWLSPDFDYDFTKVQPQTWTVVQTAITLAVYMGFSEIILLGCDCTNILDLLETHDGKTELKRYAYKVTDNEKKRQARAFAERNVPRELRRYADMIEDYDRLRQYCERRHVRLLNATDPTVLQCVTRVNLDDVLSGRTE